MSNDQIFQPGDKVMLVSKARLPNGNHYEPSDYSIPCTEFGRVYVVRECWWGGSGHAWMPVGFPPTPTAPNGRPIGFATANYRKLDEIQLIARALQRMNQPQTTEAK